MAQVGRKPLPIETGRATALQLVESLFRTRDGRKIFTELLTEIEQTMLAKRLATIFMLIDQQSFYRIEQVLGVSPSTSKRLHILLAGGAFENTERLAEHKKHREQIEHNVGVLLRAGLPPRGYRIKKRKQI